MDFRLEFWFPLGLLQVHFWTPLGVHRACLAVPWELLGCLWGGFLGSLGSLLGSCGHPLVVLGRSCGLLGASGALAGKIREISGCILEAFWPYFLRFFIIFVGFVFELIF